MTTLAALSNIVRKDLVAVILSPQGPFACLVFPHDIRSDPGH